MKLFFVLITNFSWQGSEYVESIYLCEFEITNKSSLLLSPKVFSRMHKLKILEIFGSYNFIELTEGLASIPDELRLLYWYHYPLEYLPITCTKNLVMLEMLGSELQKLWDGKMVCMYEYSLCAYMKWILF